MMRTAQRSRDRRALKALVATLALFGAMLAIFGRSVRAAGAGAPTASARASASAAQTASAVAASANSASSAGGAPASTSAAPSDVPAAPDSAAASDASADAGAPEPQLTREEKAFLYDLSRLTATPHRLSGSEYGQAAGDYITDQLNKLAAQAPLKGSPQVLFLDMPVWQQSVERCELSVGGRTIPLHPLRANVTVPPVTPPDGLTGPLVYAGKGAVSDYGERSPKGAIVVLDYESFDNWERAFALGAQAVIFLGTGNETVPQPKVAGVPVDQVRLYASPSDLGGFDLRVDQPSVTLFSRVVWKREFGRNIIARIPGSDPGFSPERTEPEAIVLAANYDSFGIVPDQTNGARGAANVAALLEAVPYFKSHPPRRDVVIMFLDAETRFHQGSREVYDAIRMSNDQHKKLADQHKQERDHVARMRKLLAEHGLEYAKVPEPNPAKPVKVWLKRALQNEAKFKQDDQRKELQVMRLKHPGKPAPVGSPEAEREQALETETFRWDEVRRALHKDALDAFVAESRRRAAGSDRFAETGRRFMNLFGELQRATLERFDRRITELEAVMSVDAQREALRKALTGKSGKQPWIVLHVNYDFGGLGPKWGVVVGDWTNQLFSWRAPKSEADTPGYYGRVLNALSDAAKDKSAFPSLDTHTLGDPTLGVTFAPSPYFSSGYSAGTYGFYDVSLMTGYDGRPRDGQPSDDLSHLDWRNLHRQALEGTRLVAGVAQGDAISLPAVFKAMAKSKYPTWDSGQSGGDYAGLQVSGSLKEDRPAAGALMAIWPGNISWPTQAWMSLSKALVAPGFDPVALEPVDESGRFRLIAPREDMHAELMTLGTLFDNAGRVYAISTQEKQVQKITETMRVNLFSARQYHWTITRTYDAQPSNLRVLKASADSPFRDNRSLWGELEDNYFAYISDQVVDYRLKIFQLMGPVAFGDFTPLAPYGTGVAPSVVQGASYLTERTAQDVWRLNEERLAKLRERGVTSADLELLHSRAHRALEQGRGEKELALREAAFERSASLSQRVYQPLRSSMDDLVHAIVMLLLLAIPFAFSLERLLICATSIYGRIGGFVAMFLITFGILYAMHPGFAIASTPIIIFLAFAIVLLSSLVIYIVVRKFKTELRAIQGQAVGVHDLEVSRMGTMLAAVGMGMSTMRRRPTRTTLTAITVVILTFTILSFASFSRTVGVRSVYEGPASETTHASLLIRRLDYSNMPDGVRDMLRGEEGQGGLLAAEYWLPRDTANNNQRSSVARETDGESLTTDALMGISVDELERWPELAKALGSSSLEDKQAALRSGGVFLPPIMQDVLKLKIGDHVLLNGRRVRFAGTIDAAALQRIKHLDGQSILPVDFQDPTSMAAGAKQTQNQENQLILAEEVDKDFVHLSSDQVVVGSSDLVRDLGGKLHVLTMYAAEGVDVAERGRKLAEILVTPVWASGPEGVERLILTVLTEVSGGLALFIPLLLGGLIIFGTLLGSISDREREIYTFSALGLSPGHVGVLFFAEATVYAVVGGMGGQLLAQFVALGASSLAKAGYIQPTSINYSSTNSLFAIGVVMLTVLVSAIYPAVRASKSANPGLARAWKMPPASGDDLKLTFPFTVSAYDITGVVSFLAEHFRRHDDAGLGGFASSRVAIRRTDDGHLELGSDLALAPFDLGVTQRMTLTAIPSEIEGVDEVSIHVTRQSGALGDWYRANRVFMRDLRRQFLLWRTLSNDMIEHYRMETLHALGVIESMRPPPPAPGGE